MANLLAFFSFFKGLLDLINTVVVAYKAHQKAKQEGWLEDGKEIAKAINGAETDEERRALAKKLADQLRNRP